MRVVAPKDVGVPGRGSLEPWSAPFAGLLAESRGVKRQGLLPLAWHNVAMQQNIYIYIYIHSIII